MSNIPIERKIVWSYWLAIIVLLSIALFTWQSSRELEHSNYAVSHTYNVINSLSAIQNLSIEMQSAARGFIISPRPSFKQTVIAGQPLLMENILESRFLIQDNKEQKDKLALLESKLYEFSNILVTFISIREIQGDEAAKNYFITSETPRLMLEIKQVIQEMTNVERSLLSSRQSMRDELIKTFQWLYISLLSSVFIVMIILYNSIIRSVKKSRTLPVV